MDIREFSTLISFYRSPRPVNYNYYFPDVPSANEVFWACIHYTLFSQLVVNRDFAHTVGLKLIVTGVSVLTTLYCCSKNHPKKHGFTI